MLKIIEFYIRLFQKKNENLMKNINKNIFTGAFNENDCKKDRYNEIL